MTLRFEFGRDASLPVGAWALCVRRRSDSVAVRLGDDVETFDDGFFSGVWTGPFGDPGYATAGFRAGTGARLHEGRVELLTPSHPYAGVYVTSASDRLLASNSMLCLIAEVEAVPTWGNARYFNTLSRQNRYPSVDHAIDIGGTIIGSRRLDRFVIDGDLGVHRVHTPHTVHFADYASFCDRITDVLTGLAANATSRERRHPLALVATLSAGYDSTAAAALAHDAGWRDAVTIVRPDAASDSGLAVGNHLGYRVEEVASDAWLHGPPLPEAEFLVASGPVTRVRLTASATVAGSLMLTGTMGDMSWHPGAPYLKERYRRPFDYPGNEDGFNEWALRVGTTFLPVPSIGAHDRGQLRRVADGPELAPWKLRQGYDRPLPRRIAEERGVPRDAFGRQKMASAQVAASSQMAASSRADFDAWLDDRDRPGPSALLRIQRKAALAAQRAARWFGTEDFGNDVRSWRMTAYPSWEAAHLFHWAVARTRGRYGEPRFED